MKAGEVIEKAKTCPGCGKTLLEDSQVDTARLYAGGKFLEHVGLCWDCLEKLRQMDSGERWEKFRNWLGEIAKSVVIVTS